MSANGKPDPADNLLICFSCRLPASTCSCICTTRCHRLKKDCQPYASVRKRNAKKSTSPREGAVESILPQRPLPTVPSQPQLPVAGPGAGANGLLLTPESISAPINAPEVPVVDVESSMDRFYPFKTTVTGCRSLLDDISAHNFTDAVADQNLETFRHAFLPYFPVVYIPDIMNSNFLRQQKPFLWLVIMSLCTKDMTKQFAMEYTIRQIISQRVVAEHEKNLDLLLGLICYLAWFQFHKKDRPYLTMWSQIAVSLVCELEIHKPPPGEEGQFGSRVTSFPPRPLVPHIRTLEERRAILGTYIITSM